MNSQVGDLRQQVIARLCKRRGITLVLRVGTLSQHRDVSTISVGEVPKDCEEVVTRMQQPIVYTAGEHIDITDDVITQLRAPKESRELG